MGMEWSNIHFQLLPLKNNIGWKGIVVLLSVILKRTLKEYDAMGICGNFAVWKGGKIEKDFIGTMCRNYKTIVIKPKLDNLRKERKMGSS